MVRYGHRAVSLSLERVLRYAEELDKEHMAWWDRHDRSAHALVEYATYVAADPRHDVLAELSFQAADPSHPAHHLFVHRFAQLRRVAAEVIETETRTFSIDVDPQESALRLVATWRGLWAASRLMPGTPAATDILQLSFADLRADLRTADQRPEVVRPPIETPAAQEYSLIVEAALDYCRRSRTWPTDIHRLARVIGVNPRTLTRQYPRADDLVIAMLQERMSAIVTVASTQAPSATTLFHLADWAEMTATELPGFMAAWIPLVARATHPDDSCHEAFCGYERQLRSLTLAAICQIGEAPGRRPVTSTAAEAASFTGMWVGLHLLWLYDPDGVDIGYHVRERIAHLIG